MQAYNPRTVKAFCFLEANTLENIGYIICDNWRRVMLVWGQKADD